MKYIFMNRRNLETILYNFMEIEELSRDESLKELNLLLKKAEPEAQILLLDEFSVKSLEKK